jgi:hypothetical protein
MGLRLWERRPLGARRVDEGRVSCPLEGREVDVERCYACPMLGRAGGSPDDAWVTCRVRGPKQSDFVD